MGKTRLEAFSDGVIAIILTIMVLELKVPRGTDWSALASLAPVLAGYVLSFVYVGIYWNNHHHMLHAVRHINGWVLWANLHLLFWLSLIPTSTAWLGENPSAPLPAAVYGVLLLLCAVAFALLKQTLVAAEGADSWLRLAIGVDRKGQLSRAIYVVAIACAFVRPWLAELLYLLVAMMWFVPDRRIEDRVHAVPEGEASGAPVVAPSRSPADL